MNAKEIESLKKNYLKIKKKRGEFPLLKKFKIIIDFLIHPDNARHSISDILDSLSDELYQSPKDYEFDASEFLLFINSFFYLQIKK